MNALSQVMERVQRSRTMSCAGYLWTVFPAALDLLPYSILAILPLSLISSTGAATAFTFHGSQRVNAGRTRSGTLADGRVPWCLDLGLETSFLPHASPIDGLVRVLALQRRRHLFSPAAFSRPVTLNNLWYGLRGTRSSYHPHLLWPWKLLEKTVTDSN